ncbi:MAG: hypothetical protein DMG85_19270 [Acidobacteria bacterium]|nr:MAG: hypothetical protein DMG85_19270 [Acidobacteriota bacterium]
MRRSAKPKNFWRSFAYLAEESSLTAEPPSLGKSSQHPLHAGLSFVPPRTVSLREGVAPSILGLLIKAHGAKPAVMKTPSGTFAFVVLAVIVIVAVVSCRTYQIVVCLHGGNYDIRVLIKDGAPPIHPYKPCLHPGSIKTDRVTMSKVAQSAAAGESAGNDPNVTNRVAAANGEDIITVLNALK